MKWFKHDSDANRDPKLEKLLMKYGAEGYAAYWLCLELIAAPIDKTNLNFELEHDAEILAYRLKMDSVKVEEIMHYMVGLSLFEISQTSQRITCMKLAYRLENSIVKNPQLKQIQELMASDPGQSEIIPDNLGKVRLDKTRLDTDKDKEETPAGLNQSAWDDYLSHRKDIRAKPLTKKGSGMAMKKLAVLSESDQQATVDLSISNGWQGLFPEKCGEKTKSSNSFDDKLANLRKKAGIG